MGMHGVKARAYMNDTSKTGLLEKREKNLAPIIIVGMHRSGTTMLVDIFEKLGGFFGNKYGINKEAYEFLKFHEETLRNTGGAWDNVELLKYIDEHKIAVEQLQKKFLAYSKKRKIKNYISKIFFNSFSGSASRSSYFIFICSIFSNDLRARLLYSVHNSRP